MSQALCVPPGREKISGCLRAQGAPFHPTAHGDTSMDAERNNAIGNGLNDLNKRVDELRGYL